jgi:uncharacterized membrane protein
MEKPNFKNLDKTVLIGNLSSSFLGVTRFLVWILVGFSIMTAIYFWTFIAVFYPALKGIALGWIKFSSAAFSVLLLFLILGLIFQAWKRNKLKKEEKRVDDIRKEVRTKKK